MNTAEEISTQTEPMANIKIAQVNLRHTKTASAVITKTSSNDNIEIVPAQELRRGNEKQR